MNPTVLQKLEPQYQELQHHIDLFAKGQCKITDVKTRSAPFGVYREKDGTYMCRVRRNCGRIFVENLHDLAEIMKTNQIDHAHFSTRQNIQLHGVPGENVHNTIKACTAAGMAFLGGGGNTFRSIRTSPQSGTSPTQAFDVIPHAQAIWDWISTYERAFEFGRKFKMGISAEPSDDILAGIQDLGFVAKMENGVRGFKVYCGAGMGRNPALGIELTDFLPEGNIIQAVQAVVDLFYEHGNRETRARARLRFLLQDLGAEAFLELFFQYLEKATAPEYSHQPIDYCTASTEPASSTTDDPCISLPILETSLGEDYKATKLQIKKGNLSADQLAQLAALLTHADIKEVRATPTQDILLPLVLQTKLHPLLSAIRETLADAISLDSSFSGQITSCIGASSCSVGLLPTEPAANTIERELDQLMNDFPETPVEALDSIIQGIHISGCASSCGLNQVSPIGFHGHKKRIDGEIIELFQLHLGGQIIESAHALAITNETWLVRADEVGSVTAALVRTYLEKIQTSEFISLTDFMFSKRPALQSLAAFSIPSIVKIIEE